MKRHGLYLYFVPAGFTFLFMALALIGFSDVLELRIFDAFLTLRSSPPEDKSIVLVDIDDQAVSTIGTWPISRSITADGLMLLAEMGASQAVFDIEYTDKSPRGVNSEVLEEEIPELLETEIGYLQYNIDALFTAVSDGQIPVDEAREYVDDLVGVAEKTKKAIQNRLTEIALDNDAYLAEAARFFGNSWFTVNMRDSVEDNVPEHLREYAIQNHSLTNVVDKGSRLEPKQDIIPVIQPIISSSAGLGFTNAEADRDGIRRRIFLVHRYRDAWFGQLVFRPLMAMAGDPVIEMHPRKIVIRDINTGNHPEDVHIPLSQDGAVLLDWPHKSYYESFRHVSFYFLYIHDQLFDDLVHNIRIGESANYFFTYDGEIPLTQLALQAKELKKSIMDGTADRSMINDYASIRTRILSETGRFLDTHPERQLAADLATVLEDQSLDQDLKSQYLQIAADIPDFFTKTRNVYENLVSIRTNKLSGLEGSFCIIGQTNTGSTDLGANPFAKAYPNIGTHASLVNMIYNKKFLLELSPLWSAFFALAFGLLHVRITKNLRPSRATAAGLGISAGTILAAALIFIFSGRYLAILPLAGPIILSFITTTFIRFFLAEKEKGFLRTAFSHYLSDEVVKQIIANPDKLKLGGEERAMTAIFTDIQGFSTISEKMEPVELVAMLNRYLTGMSDRVLELGGTIDKYEGDAIIAFFGAPLDVPDHAERALHAAIRMKRMEKELNQQFLTEGIVPSPLLTRIGINTGRMVVGNLGTEKKMDYTLIGDAVNLAARLEGVNKRYGTYLCVSEDTKNAAGDGFQYRRLDRIRVVGKAVPIRIFEVLEEKGQLDEQTLAALEEFDTGIELFEQRKWAKAKQAFKKVLERKPGDGPSMRFIATCNEYIANPPPENWDGVYKMDQK